MSTVRGDPSFRFYVAAELAYVEWLIIVQTVLMYYVTVSLELEEELAGPLLVLMVVAAMVS